MDMPDWVSFVKGGDWVIPDPRWNASSPLAQQLRPHTRVLDVRTTKKSGHVSQSRIMFRIRQHNNRPVWLDAGWFIGTYAAGVTEEVIRKAQKSHTVNRTGG